MNESANIELGQHISHTGAGLSLRPYLGSWESAEDLLQLWLGDSLVAPHGHAPASNVPHDAGTLNLRKDQRAEMPPDLLG